MLTLKIINDANQKMVSEYWENEDGFWVNKVSDIADKYGLTSYQLRQIVKVDSVVSDEFECPKCGKTEVLEFTSRSTYKEKISEISSKYYICQSCHKKRLEAIRKQEEEAKEQQRIAYEKEQQRLREEQQMNFDNAVWNDLTLYEKKVFLDCFELDFFELKKKYWESVVTHSEYKKLPNALFKLSSNLFIHLTMNSYDDNRIKKISLYGKTIDYKDIIISDLNKSINEEIEQSMTNGIRFSNDDLATIIRARNILNEIIIETCAEERLKKR